MAAIPRFDYSRRRNRRDRPLKSIRVDSRSADVARSSHCEVRGRRATKNYRETAELTAARCSEALALNVRYCVLWDPAHRHVARY